MTTLEEAESLYHRVLSNDDPRLSDLVRDWCPWMCDKDAEMLHLKEMALFGVGPNDVIVVAHSKIVSLAIEAVQSATVASAANAFVCSTKHADNSDFWMGPLQSLCVLGKLSKHGQVDNPCSICGMTETVSWNPIVSAQRDLTGLFYDEGIGAETLSHVTRLRWFNQIAPPIPSDQQRSLFSDAIETIAGCEPSFSAVRTAKELKKRLKGNESSWRYFVEILGFAGVLKTANQPGNLQVWTDVSNRRDKGPRSETPPPACHWKRLMGFDSDVFSGLFPEFKLPKSLVAGG